MKLLLHIEAFLILIAAVWLNTLYDGNWWGFAFFAIVPDVALLAYLGNAEGKRWPSVAYNALHIYGVPVLIGMLLWEHQPIYLTGWIAHIALDRVIGYGLKSSDDFKVTHLQKAAE